MKLTDGTLIDNRCITDAKNQTTTYTYDEMDRLKTRTDALSRTESYAYDKNGNLTKLTDRKSQVATFSYDMLNRRTGVTYPDSSVTFGYDAIGRRLKLSATGQTDVTYTYDKNSRLKTVTQGSQTVTLAYDNAGRRTSLTYPNGVVTSYGYDNANRLLSIDHIKSPTTIEALTYLNDAAGNRIKLTRANAAASLIPQAVSNTAFDVANQQTRFNSASTNLVYDNNGNLTSFTDASGTTTYTWNARNQLTAISGPSLSASFAYDGLGRRKSKTINSATTGFWYDGADVLAELSGSTPTATYIRSLSIDEPFIRKQSGGDEFYQTDALGSTLTLTDGSGASNATYTQEPFGKTTISGTSTNAMQYAGRENDGTSLQFYRARYYHPRLQRFLSEDPIGFGGGSWNVYAYVGNQPTAFRDPSGLCYDPGGTGIRYCVQTFIPDSTALGVFKGDNRATSCNDQKGSFRSFQTLDGFWPGTTESIDIPWMGSINEKGAAGPGTYSMVTNLRLGGRKIRFRGEATNGILSKMFGGLIPGVPPRLWYDMTIVEDANGNAIMKGNSSSFPSLEVCQYGGANGTVGNHFDRDWPVFPNIYQDRSFGAVLK